MNGPEGESEREKGKQTYSYNTTTGFMEKLSGLRRRKHSQPAMMLKATWATETYPNGMTATYTRNPTGQTTGLEYQKTTHCTEHCTWFSDNITPSIYGETLAQTSSLSKENYAYDTSGRLTEVQETPASSPCTARLYAYNEESDRTSLTTRKSSNETCPTEGGTTERHTYDEANRNTDEEVIYETFGNATKLPAADAGQYALTSTYYVDGQVASQTQNEKTNTYGYDPEGRTRETKTTIKTKSEPTTISHYATPGSAVAWTSEEGKTWTRNIPGIDGTLTATHSSTGTNELQLHDLQDNIVATASLSDTETKLLKTYNSTEFGVPNENKEPPKYAWSGADGITSELPSGIMAKDGITYVPLTGQPLQTQPVTIPQPVNVEPVFTDPQSSWIAETAGEGAARQIEATRESERALGEDPTHNIVLFTPTEAIQLGEALCNCAVVHGVGTAIETVANKIGAPGVGEIVEEILTGGLAESIGKELLYCGEYTKSNSANRCALEYHSVSVGGFDTWLPTTSPLSVGACYYYKKSYKTEKRGLHCKNHQYYKPGSY